MQKVPLMRALSSLPGVRASPFTPSSCAKGAKDEKSSDNLLKDGQEYTRVFTSDDQAIVKASDQTSISAIDLKRLLIPRAGKGPRVKMPTLRTKLVLTATVSTSSGGNLTSAIGVSPGSSSEFSSFAALYDECKVHGGVFHFDLNVAANTGGRTYASIMYDPVDVTALASVSSALVALQHKGPFALDRGDSAAVQSDPEAFNLTGLHEFRFSCPEGAQMNTGASTTVATGLWTATSDTAAVYGYVKYFMEAISGVVLSSRYYLVLDVSFRSRV
jgi:hypothetical protein